MLRFGVLAVVGCAAHARPPIAHRADPAPAVVAPPRAAHVALIEHDMPELVVLPPLAIHPAAPARDDVAARECLALLGKFDTLHRDPEPALVRAAINHAIAVGGDCRLAADERFGERAVHLERWGCRGRVYDDHESAWQLAAAVATTPERRSVALVNRALLMWNHAAQVTTGATPIWIATAGAFERAAAASPGDPHLAALAVDAWDNAIRALRLSHATAADLRAIRSGLGRAHGPRASQLLASLPR